VKIPYCVYFVSVLAVYIFGVATNVGKKYVDGMCCVQGNNISIVATGKGLAEDDVSHGVSPVLLFDCVV
jgi:hypothetical protein